MVRVLGDPKEHFWLMLGMARAVDVDLGEALQEGRISSQDYAGMLTKCRGCTAPDTCKALLDTHVPLKGTPGYCENQARFASLKQEAERAK